jgi:hypothetical protein
MKKQKVNWILYLILGLLAIIIISFSFNVKEYTEWFTIVSGIGCGAFASVIIALLIEASTISQTNRKNIAIFESYFAKLYFSFSQLLSSLVITCDEEKRNNVGELFWFDWLERLIEEQVKNNKLSAKAFLVEEIRDFQKELVKVEESKLLLLGQDLIEDIEFIALTNIKVDLSIIEKELNFPNTNWSRIKSIIPELKEHIEESKILRDFNHVTYKESILKLLRIRCYLNLKTNYVKKR